MTTRRKFFGWMATTPLAVKAAGDKVTADLMKIDVDGGAVSAPTLGIPGYSGDIENQLSSCINYVKLFGLPTEIEEIYRNEASKVYALDYDIANKKSWSMAFKVTCQRQRNYQRRVDALEREAKKHSGIARIRKALGFEFPTWYA